MQSVWAKPAQWTKAKRAKWSKRGKRAKRAKQVVQAGVEGRPHPGERDPERRGFSSHARAQAQRGPRRAQHAWANLRASVARRSSPVFGRHAAAVCSGRAPLEGPCSHRAWRQQACAEACGMHGASAGRNRNRSKENVLLRPGAPCGGSSFKGHPPESTLAGSPKRRHARVELGGKRRVRKRAACTAQALDATF